ncbi:MAG: rane protein of unknown function, partial [Frankiales bacterium]|nr:rane protein of unknown function [Frankiales bacterium]
ASTVDKTSLHAAGSSPAREGHVLLASNPVSAHGGTAAVTVDKDGPDAVAMSVTARAPGYVVVADGLQTAWRATVDGKPVTMLPADHALVAVPVPAGEHDVRLSYQPDGVGKGSVLSVVGLLAAVGLAFSSRIRRRRRSEPSSG